MKVACPSCNSSLTIDDKKIPAGGARIKCPTCQNVFPVKPGLSAAVPLPGGAAPASSSSGAVPLPAISAARPTATSWEDEPTRAGTPGDVPLPGASAIPGASLGAPPPSNVPKPSTRSGIAAVPLPGISAAKPVATSWDDEATRVGDVAPSAPAGIDVDFSAQMTAATPRLGAVPLPGGTPSGVRPSTGASIPLPGKSAPLGLSSASGTIPLPGSSTPGLRSNMGAVPLPGASSASGMRTSGGSFPRPGDRAPSGLTSNPAVVPLPGGFSGGDDLEVDFGSPPTNHIPLPGASSSAATQAVQALQSDEVPFSDDFVESAPPPARSNAASADFGFPDLPGDSAPGFDPPQTNAAAGGFDFDAPAAPPASGGFDFDPPPAPAAVSGAGNFDFGDPAPAPATGGFDFGEPTSAAAPPPDDLAFDFNAPAPAPASAEGPAPSFGEVDFGGGAPSNGGDLEFDPSAPKRGGGDDMEADLSTALPPQSTKSQGPSDGLEMLSFIDDTAKDAGAPATQAPVRRFHIKRRSGKVFGPFEELVIVKMLEEAQLLGNEEVSLDAENWQPIGSEPSFQAVIAKLMEAPGRSTTQMGVPQVEDKSKGPSMEKLKQLYEGRMASVAVVESKAPVPFIKRVPYIVAGVLVASIIGTGLVAGVATPYGWFFLKKIFPAQVKADTREGQDLAQARAGLLKDTFKSYTASRQLAGQVLEVKEYPEARAVWNQAVYSLQRKYNAAAPGEVLQADGALAGIELLGEKHVEALKARASSALVHNDADTARSLVDEALAREENKDDLELFFLRAEAFLQKRSIGEANGVYTEILAKNPKSARALHGQGTLLRQKNEIEQAIEKYEAALAADADHVASGIELAELVLVVKLDKAKGEAILTDLLTPEKRAQMAPPELGKALALKAETLVVDKQLAESLPVFEEAIKADPKNAFTEGRMARVLAVLNQPDKALPLFRDAATAAPDNLEYTEGYLSSLILLGKMDEATKVMGSANSRFPGNAMLAYLSGRVADALDDPKSAEDGYRRAIAADATITDAHLFLSRLYVRFRRHADALPILKQGLERDANNAALHVGMGELAFHERDFDRAEGEFKQASELNALSSEALRGLSLVALEKGKPDLALAHIEKAIEINPRMHGGRLQKGMALWKLQRLPESVQELEKAREEEPRNMQVIVTLGAVEFEQGQLSNALNHLLSALQSEPSHPDANFYMARVKNASRDHSQAVEAIKRALETDGKNPLYRYWYGRVLADAKRSDEAVVEFKQAIELNPKYVDALETLGRIYVERNQLKDAVEAFNKALTFDPGRNTARAALGDAYMKLQDWDGAIKVYTEAIEADPENPNLIYAYSRLASAYQEKGPKQFQKAVDWYLKATKIDPQNGEAFKNLGYLLKDLKKIKEAASAWKEYLKVTTDDEKTKKVVEDDLEDLKPEER
jgi:cellulose synthase operon protein C